MLSFTFFKTSKISFSLSSFLDLEELVGKGGIVLKLEFNEGLPLKCWSLFQFVEEEDVSSLYSIYVFSMNLWLLA